MEHHPYKHSISHVRDGQGLVIITLKKANFIATKHYFLEDVNIDNILVSNKISSGEKNLKYVIV